MPASADSCEFVKKGLFGVHRYGGRRRILKAAALTLSPLCCLALSLCGAGFVSSADSLISIDGLISRL